MSEALLVTVPPFATHTPPAGAAALLGWLQAQGCHDFAFADLQLAFPAMPLSYALVGAFGQSFVRDVADLPLVLRLLESFRTGAPLDPVEDVAFANWCLERTIHPVRLARALRSLGKFLEEWAAHQDARFVGFTIWSSNLLTTLLAAAYLKRKPHPPFIVAGGPQPAESQATRELGLRSGLFDAVVLGEGEATLADLYGRFRSGAATTGVPGTAWLEGGEVHRAPRTLLKMAELPAPSFERMFVPAYRRRGLRVLPHALSRGCIGECAFCSEWRFWERFRPGSAERALDQAQRLVNRCGAEHLQFTDSLLNGHWGRLQGFAEGLLQRELSVTWSGFFRADMDLETARTLARSGLTGAFVGVESLSDGTLERMNKGLDAEKTVNALVAFLRAGVEVQVGLIPGFPGEPRADFVRTVRTLLALQERFPGQVTLNVEPFVVSPGQPIFQELGEWGLTATHWDEATLELAPGLREVTSKILCSVEGAGQGSERLGALRMVNSVSTGASGSQTSHAAPQGPLGFKAIDPGVHLLAVDEAARTRYGFVTDEERGILERELADALTQGEGWSRSGLEAIDARHVQSVQRFELGYAFEPTPQTRYLRSPLLVARVLGETLWVMDAMTMGLVRLPSPMLPALERLRRPATLGEIEAAAPQVPGVRDAVEALREAGMLANVSEEPQAEPGSAPSSG